MSLRLKAVHNAYLKSIGDGFRSYRIGPKFGDFEYIEYENQTSIARFAIKSIRYSNWCNDCDANGRVKCQQLRENMKKLNCRVARL